MTTRAHALLQRLVVRGILLVLVCSLLAISARAIASTSARARVSVLFDDDWRFLKADSPGAERPDFDDSTWRVLAVPHDWSIEGPFDKDSPTSRSGGFLPAGVGWYRKHFTLSPADSRRRVFVEFDGVMANSDVWINGFRLGHRPYGYVSFQYELSAHLNFGDRPNVLAVRVDNSQQPASRWYTGAGIYRQVRLITTDPIHIEHWTTFVTTPKVSDAQAIVNVRTTVVNQSPATGTVALQVMLVNPDGKVVGNAETKRRQIAAGESTDFMQDMVIKNPVRWDISDPALYKAVARVHSTRGMLDDQTVPFGIREFRFEPDTGFWLNDRNFKLKGVCLHHDGSAFGAAVPLRVWERRLELLKQLGVNAIRTSHNPPAPEFLDLTDRMGFVVMDEMFDGWSIRKTPFDYHLYFNDWSIIDTRDTVRRDRNHPSVIIYSAGNEVRDTQKPELAKQILSSLLATFHENDPTRPVTQGLFRPNVTHDYDNGTADMLDVVGQNYRENEILAAHNQKPARKILGTENGHALSAWLALRDNAPYAGQFLWAGVDYLGESPGWPVVGFNFGLLDRTGTPRPLAFQRQSWWSDKPMVHITRRVAPTPLAPTDPGYGQDRRPQVLFSDWTPRSRAPHEEDVEVYSNCEQVELFLNGKSLGAKARPSDDSARSWKITFEPGTLRAVGRVGGRVVATNELKTAGKPNQVLLSSDRTRVAPVWDDVSYVEATVVDANGVLVPDANNLISFKVSGPGRVVAVDSGDNTSHEAFQGNERHAYQGRCFALLKAVAPAGSITLTASAPGLTGAAIRVAAVPRPSSIARNHSLRRRS